jgi:hypothetical protein
MAERLKGSDIILAHNTTFIDWRVFNPERSRKYAPPQDTVVYRLWKSGQLNKQQCVAVERVFEDAVSATGDSKGQVSSPSERVDVSGVSQKLPKLQNPAMTRLIHLMEWLHGHERQLLVLIIKDFHRSIPNSKLEPKFLGALTSGYVNGDQAHANGVGKIQDLLNSLVEFYNIRC